jgi:2-polyprenyl-6-methoxyphenol hydroxylase-like FAD-dependent oxidoreductase
VTLNVLVAGGGLGGLCLAQGLRAAGVRVRVFERDASEATRGQGFRLRIDSNGIAALDRCLPPDLVELFHATCSPPQPPRGVVLDHRLNQIAALAEGLAAAERARRSTTSDRGTLRQILLAGLDGLVEWGRVVTGVTENPDGVVVWFADGSSATGDVLVAADGVNSVIRAQVLPHATLADTGLRGIYGRVILDAALMRLLPESIYDGSPRVVGPDGLSLAIGAYRPKTEPSAAAARIAPYARVSHVADYLKWSLVGTPAALGLTEREVWAARSAALHVAARARTADWHPALAEMVRRSDPRSLFPVGIRAAAAVPPWPSGRVTLLGDAIHATTPAGGTGANVALRDAAVLSEELAAVDQGRVDLLTAIGRYEEQMREYGFAAAQRSLAGAEMIFRPSLSAAA